MRISHSAKEVFTTCAYKYFLQYFWKLKAKGYRPALAFGDAMDAGLNTLLKTRDLSKGKDAFAEKWNWYKNKDIAYNKSDLDEWLVEGQEFKNVSEMTWASLFKRGIILLEEFDAQIMPRIKKVVEVQIDDKVTNDFGDELVIKTDFICIWEDGRVILFDNKTSSVKYEDDAVRKSEQLAIYYETLKDKYDIDAAGYIVIPKRINKKKLPRVEIKVMIDDIDQETIQKTLKSYDDVLEQIKGGMFPQNKKACIGKFGKCDFYDLCHKGSMEGLEENKWRK